MPRLVIRQVSASDVGLRFAVQRVAPNGIREAPATEVADPLSRPVAGTELRLGEELRWYLECYLDYPFGPNAQRADRLTQALQAWGTEAFEALFGQGQARDFYRDAARAGHTELHLVVASDNAHVLAWPWEALRDPLVGDLAHHCRIERQLDRLDDPPPLHEGLSRERIGILLVTARPLEDDVAYRSISRPLVELIHERGLPAAVKVLRPPTFAQLRRELEEHPSAYHIVHFDGHGSFGSMVAATAGGRFRAPQGQLLFEKEDGGADPVTAAQLSALLREHRIPIAVLNACQSAMLGPGAEDAFASVATALLRAGVRSVVAMGYSLYVDAARQFLPAFYERLFASGSVAEATRAGRQALLARSERRAGFELQDWLVPVLYQQEPPQLPFARRAGADGPPDVDSLPQDAALDTIEAPYGLIGRDSAVLAIERAARRRPAGILVHGLGGVGKTTLARGYIEWLAHTQGLPEKVLWLSFADIRSAGYVLDRLVEAVSGTDAMAAPDAQKESALVRQLKTHALLVVWDNFESASGAADAGLDGAMPGEDRQRLKRFLEQLRGGATKVLITSRSDEAWLGTSACGRVPLAGLQGEERRALAQAILSDQGIVLDPKDQAAAELIDSLEGHPLMMRAVLPRLGSQGAASLLQAIERYMPQAEGADEVECKLHATLRFVEEGLPDVLKPLLYPIGLHLGHVDARILAAMAAAAKQAFALPAVEQTLQRLETAGLVQGIGHNAFRLHPALTRYLRCRAGQPGNDSAQAANTVQAWEQAFVDVMATLADRAAPRPLHEQRPFFAVYGGSIEQARRLAEASRDFENYGALTQYLGTWAENRRNLPLAQRHYEELARHCETYGKESLAAGAYHQLGLVAQERRDFEAADAWYRKSLEIKERLGDEQGAAITYHQLGSVAQERRDFEAADVWYRKALEIFKRLGNEHGAASTYHQLGIVAQERRDLEAADAWYCKSLEVEERLGNEHDAAITYHQLGSMAQERRDFETADAWYRKALEIKERLGNEHDAAITYHQLGLVAQERCDFEATEVWYRKSLEINERLGDEHGAAITYHQLGRVAEERRDFETAEAWYRKALEIEERLGDEHGAAITYHQLGIVAQERRDFAAAEAWYRNSLEIKERLGDEHGAASTYGQLGNLTQKRRDFEAAEAWYRKALEIFERLSDAYSAAVARENLQRLAEQRPA